MKDKVVLAYSGGLDTSVILHWLSSKGFEVICYVADVGQREDFTAIAAKAYASGATKVYVEDLRPEFVQNYVYKALKANAIYEGAYLLGTSLSRPLIAKRQVAIAQQEGALYIAHGATGKGNDQVRFELTYARLMPTAVVISPWKDSDFLETFKGRTDLIAYAQQHHIPISSTLAKPYSIDENVMHTSYEGGKLEDLNYMPEEHMFRRTVAPSDAPDKAEDVTITFERGIPMAIITPDGVTIQDPLQMLIALNELGGKHAIGRLDIVENRFVGIKSRGVYETPGTTILHRAHKEIESITLDREVAHVQERMSLSIAELIYNGFWESPEMSVLFAAIDLGQKVVQGTITCRLYKGNISIVSRTSIYSLYNPSLSSMDEIGGFNQSDAQGFIAIQALRLKAQAHVHDNEGERKV